MKTANTLVVVAAASSGVLAAPPAAPGHGFSVNARHNSGFRYDFIADLRKSVSRYGGAVPEELLEKLNRRFELGKQTAVLANPTVSDVEYLADINIGTPPQKLPFIFDTGSSDLWVFSTDTKADEVNGQTLWAPKNSSTATKLAGSSWGVTYGDKSESSGDVYLDVVNVGGLIVPNQAVEVANEVSSQFTGDSLASGILGLAYDKGNSVIPKPQSTWFSNIKDSLGSPLFTIRLRHQANSIYSFGYINKYLYSGDITYTKTFTDALGHRLFNSTGYSIGNGTFQQFQMASTVDTGTTIIVLPGSVAQEYWSGVKGAKAIGGKNTNAVYSIPCDAELPDFSFGIEGGVATIPGALINSTPYDKNHCIGGISGFPPPKSAHTHQHAVFGDVALKALFVVMDDGNNQIGFAKGV